MSTRWDLAAYDRDNKLVLVVEIKSLRNATPEWAARLRRNILAHGTFPNAPYFLMAFRDRFYLWTNSAAAYETITPNYVIDATPILQPYLEQAGVLADQVSEQSLGLIIATWLSELIQAERKPDEFDAIQHWLIDSGLYHAIAGGSLDYEVLV